MESRLLPTDNAKVFDETPCQLGEGVFWHPLREQLFWFDIIARRLMWHEGPDLRVWQFKEYTTAAGWVDRDNLLIATERGLFEFEIATGRRRLIVPLEDADAGTRSNDGRADPWGGFWIGTMGLNAEPGAGAIYRYFRGELRKLISSVSISNAICFAPDRSAAYYSDTATQQVMRQPLDESGWPTGVAALHIDLRGSASFPDGAVADAAGCLWLAEWGAGRIGRYDRQGQLISAISLPCLQPTCPAFGGKNLHTLFVTSASVNITPPMSSSGATFRIETDIEGVAEPRIIL
ncbi:SMP-30/gluconolactonase/LRE family protein [Shinella sp. 838]|uniref:SMP-30/gluconolactonase/LRE family protein n=1 Tax=Shinella sp. 838 TaxID=3038164 RepID=UPI002415594F|nr:SMP-30/gluconolactonase/LRE family protein [Shinella sp. 838]MDG4674922.1 SMP-30/gluconolactonase/LRE family protein [Shinella sp. 838]